MSRATDLPRPGPITTWLFFTLCYSLPILLNPPFPLSVLPMNVSISLVMCKLFSPAQQADGEQCLCRDFLCMSFLISKRVRRFPCFFLEKVSLHAHITLTHTHVLTLTICNQYAWCVVGILVQWWRWQGSLQELTVQHCDGLILRRGPGPELILAPCHYQFQFKLKNNLTWKTKPT